MNITVTKIKRELKKNHGWDNLDNEEQKWFANKYSHWRLKYEIKDPIY